MVLDRLPKSSRVGRKTQLSFSVQTTWNIENTFDPIPKRLEMFHGK